MTTPGWYEADGDPPGTQRYWDGEAWIGHPVYEPSTTPVSTVAPWSDGGYVAAGAPQPKKFPTSLKAIAIVLAVIKAIPLALLGVVLLWVASVSNSINDDFDEFDEFNFDGLLNAAVAVLAVVLVVGFALLLTQFVGAIRERPIMVFVPALIMSIGDSLLAVGSWVSFGEARSAGFSNAPSGGAILMTIVAGVQIFVAVQAIRVRTS